MGSTLTGLIETFVPGLIGLPLAVAGGILMSQKDRHAVLARRLMRGAVIALGVYPVLWARDYDGQAWVAVTAAGCCGAALGAGFYLSGLWYRIEQAHSKAESKSRQRGRRAAKLG